MAGTRNFNRQSNSQRLLFADGPTSSAIPKTQLDLSDKMTKGKWVGYTVEQMIENNTDYASWYMTKNDRHFTKQAMRYMRDIVERSR